MRRRSESIKYKLMPEGHIRAYQSDKPDLGGVAEMMIHQPFCISPTITVAHAPKILIADERILKGLMRCIKG